MNQHLSDLPMIAKGAGILFLGTAVGKVLIFLFSIFIARMLTTGELGLYYLGSIIVSLAAIVAHVGLDSGALRFVSLFHGQKDSSRVVGTILSCLTIVIPVSLFIAILIFLSAEKIAVHIFHKPDLDHALRLFSISIPFITISSILISATLGFKLMQYKAAIETGEIILRFVFTLLFVYVLGLGLGGAAWGWVISGILAALLAFGFTTKSIRLLRSRDKPILEFRGLLRFSYPQIFSQFFICAAGYTDTLMLGYFRTSQEVGIYNIAARVAFSAIMISESFRLVFAPRIADLHNRGHMEQLSALFKVVTKWAFTLSLPVFLVLILFPEAILNIFGKEFTVGSTCLIILCFGYLLSAAAGPANYMVLMTGRSGLNFLNHFIALGINLTLNYFLIPRYGIVGAALATSISIVSVDIIRLLETFYLMKIQPYNWNYLKPLLAGGISTVIIFFVTNTASHCPTTIGISIFLGCYLFIIYTLKFGKEEVYILKEVQRKLKVLIR